MTATEHRDKALCFLCSYGELVSCYNNNLRRGNWDLELECKIQELSSLLDLFLAYNVLDLPEFTTNYNNFTEDGYNCLKERIEFLLA